MKSARLGRYIVTASHGEAVRAFVPPPLPPQPALDLTRFYGVLDRANQALGRLDGLQSSLPDMGLFLFFYNRREAVLSSQIEGTQSSLSDLLLFENDLSSLSGDAEEVSNYVAAMQHGLSRLATFPLSNRLIKEMHAILLRTGRGSEKTPGEFRRSQNWIGGTRPGNAIYVPPPVAEMEEVMSDLERFLHREEGKLPLLIDAALVHVQFESAHPFLDGNGRIGRLLISLLLCERRVLQQPALYLSLYFKQHRDRYYELLQIVRTEGKWETWIEFFLEGVRSTAEQACETAIRIKTLFETHQKQISAEPRSGSAARLHSYLQKHPITDLKQATSATQMAKDTLSTAMKKLIKIGVARELTGNLRGRVYAYSSFIDLLNEGTEPFPAKRAQLP